MGKYILVGPNPKLSRHQHPGGQLTAVKELISFAKEQKIELKIIDSSQSNFPVPPLYVRLSKALFRFMQLVLILLSSRPGGAIVFSSAGLSFYEKSLMTLFCRIFFIPSVLLIRSGHFIDSTQSASRAKLFLIKLFLKFPHKIVAQGTPWIKFYQETGLNKSKLVMVRNWLPESIAHCKREVKKNTENKVSFLFAGWVVEKKGVRELLEAFSQSDILKEHAELTIAGGGDLLDELKNEVIARGLSQIKLPGWVEQEEVHCLMDKHDVFVLPTYAEGFPNVLLEAMSHGMAVISTDVGAITDSAIHQRNALIVPPKDSLQLQKAMQLFIKDRDKLYDYSCESLEIVKQQHDRNINCQKLFDIFKTSSLNEKLSWEKK